MIITKTFSSLLSDKTRTKKAALNSLATALDYVARIAVSFVINPLLLTGLGNFGYGTWQVLERMTSTISSAGGRPNQALKWTIANQQTSTDYEEKRRQVGSAVTVWFMFLPLLSLVGAVLTWYVPKWLNAPLEAYPSIRWAAALLVANLIFKDLALIPQSVLRGENLGYKRMGVSTLFVLVGGGLVALALFLKTGMIGVAAANVVTTALTGLLFLRIVHSHVIWFGIAKPIFSGVRRYFKLSWWFLSWTLVMQLLRAGDVVVLGILDSAELVTRYTLTKYIPETIIGFVAIIVFGITPGLGGVIGSRDLEKAVRVRSEIMIFTWFIVTVVGSTMLLWNHSFVRLWVGEEYYAGIIPNLLIVMMVTQFVFIRNDSNIIDLTLDLRQKVLIGALAAALSAGISSVLVGGYKMGIIGLSLGFVAGQSVLSIGYPFLVGRFLEVSLYSQLKGVLRPAFVTFLFLGSATALADFVMVKTWLDLVLLAMVTVGLLSSLAFYAGLTGEQRQRLLSRVRHVLQQPG